MHNRNFIINMVINGEKAPAFSAKTLNLPTPQDDNTGRIIQWTREHYSQPREVIEQSISERILPPENLQVKRPGPAYTAPKSPEEREADRIAREKEMFAQGKTWPIEGITPDAQNTELRPPREDRPAPKEQGSDRPERPATPSAGDGDQKRKRTRSRGKRKPDAPQQSNEPNRPRIIREGQESPRPEPRPSEPPKDPTLLSLR
jgi:hypothetical protein